MGKELKVTRQKQGKSDECPPVGGAVRSLGTLLSRGPSSF